MDRQAPQIRRQLLADFIDYIDRPGKTEQTYLTNLRAFFAWLAYSGIDQPGREDIKAFRSWLMVEHPAIRLDSVQGWAYRLDRSGRMYTTTCSAATASQYLRTIKQFFKWTASRGLYPDISAGINAPKIRADRHRKQALTPADVRTIEQSILDTAAERTRTARDPARAEEQGKRLYALFELAVNAGLRCIELSRADRQDLELIGGQAWLYVQGKGHAEKDTKKALAHEVYKSIKVYLDARTDKSPAMFTATGSRSGGQRLSPVSIGLMLKAALRSAGYDSDRITAHSLRHTAGTCVQALTGDLYATQQYMRHANPATTEIYLHLDTEARDAETAEALYKMYHQG